MTGDFTPRERVALDRLTVPAMRAGLAADIVSRAMVAEGHPTPARRDTRGGWRRRGVVLASTAALLLASAGAAATGLFDRLPAAIPAIASAIGVVSRTKPEKPKPTYAAKRANPRPAPVAASSPPAQTLKQRAAELRARIAAMPPARQAQVRAKIDALNAMTPTQRANTIELARQRMMQRHPELARRLRERRGAMGEDREAATAPSVGRDVEAERFRERRRLRVERRRQMIESAPATPALPAPEE